MNGDGAEAKEARFTNEWFVMLVMFKRVKLSSVAFVTLLAFTIAARP